MSSSLENNPSPVINFRDYGVAGIDADILRSIGRSISSYFFPDAARRLNIPHVRGMLFWGRPGVGKTKIARAIAKILHAEETVKIFNGPEMRRHILEDGEAGEQYIINAMFESAENEWREKGALSHVHVIIIDEIEAVFPASSGLKKSSFINRFLSHFDGVSPLMNVMVIGLTSHRHIVDESLLRPGRLEVSFGIPLPTAAGREEIFQLLLSKLHDQNHLEDSIMHGLRDLAWKTEFFSGAEIESVVRGATGHAFERAAKHGNSSGVKVAWSDLELTIADISPAGRW